MIIKSKSILIAIPFAFLVACSSTAGSSTGFQLKGKLSNAHGETIYLEQMSPSGLKGIDTVKIDDKGEFSMTPKITEIGYYRLKIAEKNYATLILDANQQVMVGGDASNLPMTYTVEGSPDSKLFWEISRASEINYRKRDSLQKTFQAMLSQGSQSKTRVDSLSNVLEKPYNDLLNQHNLYLQNFIKQHPSSFASLAAIQQLKAEEFPQSFKTVDSGLVAKYPNSAYVKSFHESYLSSIKTAIGSQAPEIALNNPDDKPLALSSMKGKVVLIDFWASWCGPCRAENPNVVKAYNKYKAKGFDIFSVSLDKDVNKWKQAIQADHLTWPNHVSDLKAWSSSVVQLYSFNSIPTNVLIDKNGIIIAKNLRGEDLEKKLSEVFK